MRKILPAMAVAVALVTSVHATQYPVRPDSGEWLILVQSYTGDGSAKLAEDLAASLRRDYKLNAFVFNRGEEERAKEQERVAKLRAQQREAAKASGLPIDSPLPKIKTVRIEDQYAVVVGGWKDIDAARKALDDIRKLKPPADRFMHSGLVVPPTDAGAKERQAYVGTLNPFRTAFVVHNPMVPMPPDPDKGKLQNLKEYNAGESLSLLKCRKPYTLMVKMYQGIVRVASANESESDFMRKLTGTKPGQYLNAAGQQAHTLAEALKQIRDERNRLVIDTDVYVLHTETASYVCVGGFDRPDDPVLLQYQKRLANLRLGVVDALSPNPMPMPVPKP